MDSVNRGTFWPLSWNWVELKDVFVIDLRSLALVRIVTAFIILIDLAVRAPYIAMFYGDGGVLPTAQLYTFWMGDWAWSFHTFFGGPPMWVALLFIIQALAAIALLVGFQTRVSSIVSWIFLVSLHNANPLILLGGDFLLRAILFVGMFLPWGEFFSADRYMKAGSAIRTYVLSPWSATFLIQLGFLYYFASIFKNSFEWSVSGSAMYYIANIDQYATPLAKFLLNFPHFLSLVTLGIVKFQHIAIYLLFFPIWNRYVRTITASILILMHIAFALGANLGIFSWITIAGLLAFFPAMVWDAADRGLATFKNARADMWRRWIPPAHLQSHSEKSESVYVMWFRQLVYVLGVLYIVYVFVWQASEFLPMTKNAVSSGLQGLPAKVLRIDQRWNLFAPHPYVNDGWDIVEGQLADGSDVDLFRNGAPISFEKPDDVYGLYGSSHMREFTLEIRRPNNEKYRRYYAQYLCRSWNSSHDALKHLNSLELIFMLEVTPPPGASPKPVALQSLLTWTCE